MTEPSARRGVGRAFVAASVIGVMLVECSTDGSEEESAAPSEATSSETETGGVASTPDEWRAAMEAAAEDDVAIELCGAIFADDDVARAAMEYVPVVKTAGGHSTSQGGQDIAGRAGHRGLQHRHRS